MRNAIFKRRLKEYGDRAETALKALYGDHPDFGRWKDAIFAAANEALKSRPEDLFRLDGVREVEEADWFQRPEMVGYMCYADRFAGTLNGVTEKVGYLKSLGVRYLHLLSVLRKRKGGSDGGFAIADYSETNPELGSMADLEKLAGVLRRNRISLCLDFVYNHVSDQHRWAQKAMAGDPHFREFFYIFPDREMPDRYETTLGEVFPDTQPGNFTFNKAGNFWVWTTFYPFQWDLNYRNPAVFLEMLKIMLFLANKGVEIFRMDAAAFAWKELGTDCLNLPQTHSLLQAFRSLLSIAAPATVLKAEAIVGARDVAKYFGQQKNRGSECQLAYHNPLMAAMWNSLALKDVTQMSDMLASLPDKPPGTAWVTYARCHDDIGWGTLQDARGAAWSADDRQLRFLSDFYAGELPGSFARGRKFQVTEGSGFHGTNGTLASLAGLEEALESGVESRLEQALARMRLLNTTIFAFNGIPLIFMGEEIGLLNDRDFNAADSKKDGRWLHRPAMPWGEIDFRQKHSLPSRIRESVVALSRARGELPVLHSENPVRILDSGNKHIFAFTRENAGGAFMFLGNFADTCQWPRQGVVEKVFGKVGLVNCLDRQSADPAANPLGPYESLWLVAKNSDSR